jgi:hypothetical protein
MTRFRNRSLLIAAAGLMIALPLGWAVGEQQTIPDVSGHAMPGRSQAMTQMPCGKRTDVVRMLRENFGEGPIAQGLANTGAVAEVFLNSQGNWTIVVSSPNGLSCMIGAGESWQPVVARDDTM